MRRLMVILILLSLALSSLWANANKISTAAHPRYAADIVKIQLSKEAIKRTNLPQGLYAEAGAFGINELDQLFSIFGGTKIIRAHRRLKDVDWEQRTGFDRWFLVKLDGKSKVEDAIRAFAKNRYVEQSIPEYYAYTTAVPNDTYYANNWGHNNTAQLPAYSGSSHSGAGVGTIGYDADMQLAWDQSQGYGSASTIIAIIDTGVDTNHPDLRLVAGYDYGVGDNNPMDDSADPGHGTSCSGVAAGRANNGLGLTGAAGGCSVMPLKIADASGSLGFTAIENALTHTGDNNVDVASMSFGAEGGTAEGDSPSTDTALEYAYAHGVTLLAATANSNTSTIAYPSNHNKVISVGASSPTGQRKSTTSSDGENWWGSNYGTATQDDKNAVDIMAPTILPSTDLMGTAGYNTSASPSGDYYMWFNGTSCATPYAAGVAALLISKDPTLTPAQVRQALVSTCTDMTVDGGAGWDRYTGYGMVNANAALLSLVPGMPSCTITAPTSGTVINLNSTVAINVTATDTDGTISSVKFYVDDVLKSTDTVSPYSWSWNTTGYSAGSHTIKAVATDNSSNTATSTVSVSLLAPADEGFETGNFSAFPWVNTSAIPWTVQNTTYYSGSYAAKAGGIGDSATTTLSISLNITTAGNLSFYYKVSSESNYDFLQFWVDGVKITEWSGTVDWTQYSYSATVGSHTFAWTYSKDVNTASGSDAAWLDHLNFPAYNNFYAPTNLTGNAGSGSVALSWTAPVGSTPSSYKVYRNSALLTTTAGTSYTDNAVTNGTSYTYYVTAVYTSPAGESSPSNSVTVIPSTTSQVTIGTGASTNSHLPVEPYYGYTYSQSIILQSELNLSNHYITKIAWQYNGYEAWTDAIVVYMGHTTNTAFASTSSWIPLTSLTQVYSGNLAVNTTSGWVELTLDTPFLHNNTQNLVIAVDENTAGYHSNSSEFYASSVTGNRSIYYYNDTTNPNPSSPPTSGSYIGVTAYIPNTKLSFVPLAPVITVNPNSLAYGMLLVNTTSSNSFQISNTGSSTLSGIITTPAGYSVSTSRSSEDNPILTSALGRKQDATRNSLSYNVAEGSSSTFYVTFAPTAVQTYNGNIIITHNAGGSDVTIALTGHGGKPVLGLSSTSFTASLAPGASSSQSLSVSNSGNMSLSYGLTISGSAPWLTINGGTSVSSSIAVGGAAQAITLDINAAGMAPGSYSATINGSSNDPASATYAIGVSLTVTTPITISAPAGGEVWQSGLIKTLRWNYSGTAPTNTIYYSTNGGGSWTSLGTISVAQGVNSHSWTVPFLPSTNCLIKVQDGVAPNYAAVSNVFSIITPSISIDPASLAFGTLMVNTTTTHSFTIANSGTATLIGSITTPVGYTVAEASSRNGSKRELLSQSTPEPETRNAVGYSLPAGSNKTFNVTFAPTAVQAYDGNITIAHNALGSSTLLALTGQGGKPVLGFTPGTFTENLAPAGSSSQTLTVSNSGNLPLNYSFSLVGTPSWLSLNGGNTVSNVIAIGGASQDIIVGFNASGLAIGTYHATINGTCNDPSSASFSIGVTLNVLSPIIDVVETQLAYGTVRLNTTATQNFTISNSGNALLSGSISTPDGFSVALGRSRTQSEMELGNARTESASSRNTLDYSVPQGESIALTVTFAPVILQNYTGNITITHNAGGAAKTIALTGMGGMPDLRFNPASVSDSLLMGESSVQAIYLNNMGNMTAEYTLSVEGTGWLSLNGSSSISGSIVSSGPEVQVDLGISAAELAEGTYYATVTGTSNGLNNQNFTIPVTLVVVNPNAAPVITLPDSFAIAKNGILTEDFTPYVSDADNDELWLTCVEPAHVIVGIEGMNVTFTPATDWTGSETVQFTVHDGTDETIDTVEIMVSNTPPVITLPAELSFNRNSTLDVDFTPYVSDANGDPLNLAYAGNTGVLVSINGLNVSFGNIPGFVGTEEITFRVSDGSDYSEDVITIQVNNQAPALVLPLSFAASENTPLVCDFSPYASDPNNDALTLDYSGNTHVAVEIDGMNVTFSPAAGWYGTEDITFTVSDGDLQAEAIAHLVVSHVVLSLETPALTIAGVAGNRLLQWNSIPDADEYRIYRATDPEGEFTLINTTLNLEYLDTDILDAAFYYVKAVHLEAR